MWQGDGASSDFMMVKHAYSKQRVVFFVITSHKRKRQKVELSLSHRQRANLIYSLISDKRLITHISSSHISDDVNGFTSSLSVI